MARGVISLLVVISLPGSDQRHASFTGGAGFLYCAGNATTPTFRLAFGAWNERTGVPLRSLAMQALIHAGTGGRPVRDRARGFERLVVFTAPFYWGFIRPWWVWALIVLRSRGATTAGHLFGVPLLSTDAPWSSRSRAGAMVYAGIDYAIEKAIRGRFGGRWQSLPTGISLWDASIGEHGIA